MRGQIMNQNDTKKPRGWNFKKGAKDYLTLEEYQRRAKMGPQRRKENVGGFKNPEVLKEAVAKSVTTRKAQSKKKKEG